jgi:hypothetical protein
MTEWWSAFFMGLWIGATIFMLPSLLWLAWLLWIAPTANDG